MGLIWMRADSRASSRVETGMSGNFLSCSKGVKDPTVLFLGKVCRKNPGFDKDQTDVMFGLTLYDFTSFIPLYVQIKV